jgi:hypothetical protein
MNKLWCERRRDHRQLAIVQRDKHTAIVASLYGFTLADCDKSSSSAPARAYAARGMAVA